MIRSDVSPARPPFDHRTYVLLGHVTRIIAACSEIMNNSWWHEQSIQKTTLRRDLYVPEARRSATLGSRRAFSAF